MSSMTNTFEEQMLDHVFLNQPIANIGNLAGLPAAGVAGNLYVALFTADPTEAGSQVAEATFGGYARQPLARGASGFSRTGSQITNVPEVAFAEATSGSETITHFAYMKEVTGGDMILHNIVGTSRLVEAGTTLRFVAGALTVDAD